MLRPERGAVGTRMLSSPSRFSQVILKVRMKWWEAGTVIVRVSRYESCSDLTQRRLSKGCVIAKPSQRTGERSTKLRAYIGSCLAI